MRRRCRSWRRLAAATLVALLAAAAMPSFAATLCTVVADAPTGRVVHEEGECDSRVTPASTFKIVLALMGYDAGFLADAHAPLLPFKQGYSDWIDAWKQPTDPEAWMRNSVVWYSQRITEALGEQQFAEYLAKLDYGNRDGSGDPGRNNALERSWISSSLKISPREQVRFLTRMLAGDLPVSRDAIAKTMSIVEDFRSADGSTVRGKTGSAYPRKADGSFDRTRGWGWFVGWTEYDGRMMVFARLAQDDKRHSVSGGLRARDSFLQDFPAIAAALR